MASKPGGLGGGAMDSLSGFVVMVTGQIEAADFPGLDNLYCKYSFTHGPDWTIVQGVEQGVSQVAKRGMSDTGIVWNFPVDVMFKATNAFGWPRLVVAINGLDALGRDVVRGYGSVLIPTVPGRYTRYIRTFVPLATTKLQEIVAWMKGNPTRFYDAKFVGQAEGREVTRVKSSGVVIVQITVTSRGMTDFGYTGGTAADATAAAGLSGGGGFPSSTMSRTAPGTGLRGRPGSLPGTPRSAITPRSDVARLRQRLGERSLSGRFTPSAIGGGGGGGIGGGGGGIRASSDSADDRFGSRGVGAGDDKF